MEIPPQHYELSETIITSLGNKVHRRCNVYGSGNIHLANHVNFKILKKNKL